MDLVKSLRVSAAGLAAESTRLRVVAENLANADSMAQTPGGEPYRRKVVSFGSMLDRTLGMKTVRVTKIGTAAGDFERRYDPAHPAADQDGYVLLPNVNPLIELNDMREAQRSYQANLNVIDAAKTMISRTIDILHG
ncbi:MAG TPA: flagellar basal body rod protein FlgC [Stellaceae bacterium]|jgi:flagellar basal-body rod protein FlgC